MKHRVTFEEKAPEQLSALRQTLSSLRDVVILSGLSDLVATYNSCSSLLQVADTNLNIRSTMPLVDRLTITIHTEAILDLVDDQIADLTAVIEAKGLL